MAGWWKTYRDKSKEVLIILIDTNLHIKFNTIKEKYSDIKNIMIYNHVELQQYIIDTYHSSESI